MLDSRLQAVAITKDSWEAYERQRSGGGPGRGDDGFLSAQWKKWAKDVVSEKINEIRACFNSLGRYENPAQLVEAMDLERKLAHIQTSVIAAKQAVLDYSPVLNAPVANLFLKPIAARIPVM